MTHDHYGLTAPDGGPPRVVLYPRVSKKSEIRQGHGFEYQLDILPALAEQFGLRVVATLKEPGISADSLSARPSMRRILQGARDKEWEVALATVYDRFSRGDPKDWGEIAETCDETGLVLMHANGIFYDRRDPSTRMNVWMFGGMAEAERLRIRERTMNVRNALAKKGKLVAGLLPYGFRVLPRRQKGDDRIGEHDPLPAAVMRRAFDYLSGGDQGAYSLCRLFNAEGILSPGAYRQQQEGMENYQAGAGKWSPQSLRRLIRNPAYYGRCAYGREASTLKAGKKTATPRPEEEWKWSDLPPIVSYEKWLAANRAVEGRRGRVGRPATANGKALLSGLIVCAECGRRFRIENVKWKESRYVYYACNGLDGAKFGGQPCPYTGRLRSEQIEPLVWETVDSLLTHPEQLFAAYQQAMEERQAEAAPKVAREDPERELKRLEELEKKYWADYDNDTLTGAEIRPRLDRIAEQRRAVEARMKGEEITKADEARDLSQLKNAVEHYQRLRAKHRQPNEQQKREILQGMIKEIRITGPLPGGTGRVGEKRRAAVRPIIALKALGAEIEAEARRLSESGALYWKEVPLSENEALCLMLPLAA